MPSQSWQMVATLNEPESTHDMESTPAWLADGTHLLEVYGVRPLCGRQVNPCNEAGTAGAQLLESIENCVPRVQILMSFRLPPFHWKSAMRKPWEESLRGALHVLSLPVLCARSRVEIIVSAYPRASSVSTAAAAAANLVALHGAQPTCWRPPQSAVSFRSGASRRAELGASCRRLGFDRRP